MNIFLPMIPPTATHQEKKINWKSHRVYESDQTKDARAKLRAYLAQHKPDQPMEGPLSLSSVWHYPATENHPDNTPRMEKPDCDNMNKLLQDVMADLGFFKNDSQIVLLMVAKGYSKKSGILINLESVRL